MFNQLIKPSTQGAQSSHRSKKALIHCSYTKVSNLSFATLVLRRLLVFSLPELNSQAVLWNNWGVLTLPQRGSCFQKKYGFKHSMVLNLKHTSCLLLKHTSILISLITEDFTLSQHNDWGVSDYICTDNQGSKRSTVLVEILGEVQLMFY